MAMTAHPSSEQPSRTEKLCSGAWTCAAIIVIVGLTAALAAFIANGLLSFP